MVYYEKNVLRHGERYYNALNQKEPWQYNASPDWKDTIHAAAEDSDGRIVSRDGAFPAELTKAGGTAWAWDCQDTPDIGGMASNTNVTMTSAGES